MPVTWSLSGLTCFSGPVFVSVSDGFSALLRLHLSVSTSFCLCQSLWMSLSLCHLSSGPQPPAMGAPQA